MPFAFDPALSHSLPEDERPIEDRRDNPVRGRPTQFRLAQANMLAYTFPDFVPGFTAPGINRLPFPELLSRPLENAQRYGKQVYGPHFGVSPNQIAKVAGDIFQLTEAAILWNAAARWNRYMAERGWENSRRLPEPTIKPNPKRQIAAVRLPRSYDWVKLLESKDAEVIKQLRKELKAQDLELPTSPPGIIVTVLPEQCRPSARFLQEIPDLGHKSQKLLDKAHKDLEGLVSAKEIVLAISLSKSLRSDRVYQPLYEANMMQLLLGGLLGAPPVEFEVHTLDSAGTAARDTYRAVSLATVIPKNGKDDKNVPPHRAVRELYEPANADDLARRFLKFLTERMPQIPLRA